MTCSAGSPSTGLWQAEAKFMLPLVLLGRSSRGKVHGPLQHNMTAAYHVGVAILEKRKEGRLDFCQTTLQQFCFRHPTRPSSMSAPARAARGKFSSAAYRLTGALKVAGMRRSIQGGWRSYWLVSEIIVDAAMLIH